MESADGLSARALLRSIRHHPILVAGMLLLFCAVGSLIGLGLPPHFKAEGVLVIHSQPQRVADVQEVLPDPATDMAAIRSEVDVLRSRSVIERVVRSLALWQFPEFQKSAYPGAWDWETLRANLRTIWESVGGTVSAPPKPVAATPRSDIDKPPTPGQIDGAIGKYAGHLSVDTDGHSMTITVAFTAWTPELAAKIVDAHMESYRALQQQDKASAAQRANGWLTAQVAKLRDQLRTATAAVAQYRVLHHLTGTANDHNALSQQLAALTAQLIVARADLAESEARAAEIGGGGARNGGAANVPEVVASPTIQALRAREARLIEREAALTAEFGTAYPELQRVRSSLADLRQQIAREVGRGYNAALQLVQRSRAREQSIQRSVLDLTEQVNSSDAELRELEGRADSIRSLLDRFQKRMEETAAEPAFITANSTIVTRADAAAVGKSPIALFLAVGGAFFGLILGVLLALLRELRDRTFKTSLQIEQHFEPRAIGATPRAIRRGRKSPAELILNDNRSGFAEAFRLSLTNIQFAIQGNGSVGSGGLRHRTVLGITSAFTGEGKSTHALALARTAALAGERVVLVDADLRRSGVSRLLDRKPTPTLNDFLQGRCTAEEAAVVEQRSGMHFVASTPVGTVWTSADFRRFGELIDRLRERFEIVIVDLPPVLGLAETIRLATATDGVALIIRWGRTDRRFVGMALQALHGAGITATTAILNDIDLKAQRRRNYHDRTVVYSLYEKHYA